MYLSKIAISIGQSATLKLNELANNLKKEGKDIIHLGGGEPEADIPDTAYTQTIEKLKTKRIRYTPASGIKELKDKVVKFTKDLYNIEIDTQNVLISSGAKQAIYNFLVSVINPGDEVIFPIPYWVSYPEMVKLVYGQPIPVKPSKGLLCSIQDIEKHITSNTKAILLNSPNNPTGLIYNANFIKEIVNICEERNIYLMMDDIYNKLVFDNIKIPSVFEFSSKNVNESLIVIINGISKSFSMTGFRIGWAIGSKSIIQAMSKIQAQTTSCPSELSQIAAIGALKEGETFIKNLVKDLQDKRNILMEEILKLKKVKIEKPQGTFYSFPDFSNYEKDSNKLANYILEKTGVVTVPGKEFGMDGHLRISYCGSEKNIIEGIRRIKKLLD